MRPFGSLLLASVIVLLCGCASGTAADKTPPNTATPNASKTVAAASKQAKDAHDRTEAALRSDAQTAQAAIPTAPPTATAIPIPTATPAPPYKLALTAAQCTQDASIGFNTCDGSVQNISGDSLEDIEVVIEWADAGGVVQSSDEALISYNPILDGQTSPWQVIGRYNPALTHYRVVFKALLGGTILTRDDR